MIARRSPPELALENYAFIAAQVDVHNDRPRSEVLALFNLDDPTWETIVAEWTQRMVDEIRTRASSTAPIAERYPLTSGYAAAYARAVREAREDLDHGEEEATVRIAPGTPLDEPFSVFGASNRAAAEARKNKGKTA